MAEYNISPENINEPARRLQMALDRLSLQARAFLLGLPEFQRALEGITDMVALVEDLEAKTKEQPNDQI